MNSIFINLYKLFLFPGTRWIYGISALLFLVIWWYFTDVRIMFGNYGYTHTYTDLVCSMLIILGFPLFLCILYYRGKHFGKSGRTSASWFGFAGGMLGTIISGASCCGSTLALYVGLVPFMSLFPYDGLELKILSVCILFVALGIQLKHMDSCRIRKK